MKPLCESAALLEGGQGLRFEVVRDGQPYPAFAIRYKGAVYGYLNRCAHVGVQLDWQHGEFFDAQGALLICATHGALYDPQSGKCIEGPCRGKSLTPVALQEADGFIHCFEPVD